MILHNLKKYFIRNKTQNSYSVMQSDGNSFCGDVVLDRFYIVYSDEDSIKDQKYEKRILGFLLRRFQNFRMIEKYGYF